MFATKPNRRHVTAALIVLLASCSRVAARDLCGKKFETIDELRAQIAPEFAVSGEDPNWTAFRDRKEPRLWIISKETSPEQFAVCVSADQANDGSWAMKAHITCKGTTAACDKIGAFWTKWANDAGAAMKAGMAEKRAAPSP